MEAIGIFRHADSFFWALDRLHKAIPKEQAGKFAIPLTVLSCFASELFLKCLSYMETGEVTRTHLLSDLFDELSSETQKILEKHWDALITQRKKILDRLDKTSGRKWPRDLRSNLKEGSDGFRLLRYVYEGGADFSFNLSDLPIALRNTITEIKPEWNKP